MKLTDFLVDLGNYVAYYPKLVEISGGVLPNLFLCQMYYWLGKQKNPEGWIYKTQAEIEKETGLSRKEQESARKSLKARGLLKEKFTGCPRRLEFWLDKDALNQRWSAFMNNLELPIMEITKAWTRKSDKALDDVDRQSPIMPNSSNIDSPKSAICNALTEQYIMSCSSNTECPSVTGCNALDGHAVMPQLGNISIYTKNTSKITTYNAPPTPGAPPTHECVSEEKTNSTSQLNEGKEIIPESSCSLLIKPGSSSQTDNPSCGLSIAAGLFDKSEQTNNNQAPPLQDVASCEDSKPSSLPPTPNPQHPVLDPYKSAQNVESLIEAWITDPTTFADDFVPMTVREKIKWNRWVLPWRTGDRRLNNQYQNFNPIVVDLIALELANASSCSPAQKITHAIAVMNTWEKTKGGWTNLMQRYQQAISTKQRDNAPTPTKQTSNQKANISLAQAIAEDEKRHQQEQSKQTNSVSPQHISSCINLKEKLLSLTEEKKVRKDSRLSSAALFEVEAQLKQALGVYQPKVASEGS